MSEYIYFSPEGKILGKSPKGKGRVRKGAIERPEGSGKYYIPVPAGMSLDDFLETQSKPAAQRTRILVRLDQDGNEIERRDFRARERVPEGAIETPQGSGIFVLKIQVHRDRPTEVVEVEEDEVRSRRFRQKAIRKIEFPLLRQCLFVSSGEKSGWFDGWEDGRNVFWANNCVVTGKEGIGELLFNAVYARIEIDFDNSELRIFDHAPREAYGDEPCDGSKVVLSQVFQDAVAPCNLEENREMPKRRRAERISA